VHFVGLESAFCWVRVMNSSLVLSVLSDALSNFIPLKFKYFVLPYILFQCACISCCPKVKATVCMNL
jgi:hypothetical protein